MADDKNIDYDKIKQASNIQSPDIHCASKISLQD